MELGNLNRIRRVRKGAAVWRKWLTGLVYAGLHGLATTDHRTNQP